MHSTLVRVQNVFGFFTTVAFCVAAVIALSVFINPQAPSAEVQLRNVQVVRGRPHYYSYKKEEYAHIKFDLDADLSSLFNWNTKQVFVYLKVKYPPHRPGEPPSEAIIWDAILPAASAPWHQNHYNHPNSKAKSTKPKSRSGPASSKKAAADAAAAAAAPYPRGELHVQNQRPKFQITDISGRLQNRTGAVLELGWNVQPWVGALVWANRADYGAWKGVVGGRSAAFDFPEIKTKRETDLGTEKGGEHNRGKPA